MMGLDRGLAHGCGRTDKSFEPIKKVRELAINQRLSAISYEFVLQLVTAGRLRVGEHLRALPDAVGQRGDQILVLKERRHQLRPVSLSHPTELTKEAQLLGLVVFLGLVILVGLFERRTKRFGDQLAQLDV